MTRRAVQVTVAACLLWSCHAAALAQDYRLALRPNAGSSSGTGATPAGAEPRDFTWLTKVEEPDVAVYLPTRRFATRQAVVICPGGGYVGLAYDLEGTDIARFLSSKGVAAIVLKYRLPKAGGPPDQHTIPLADAKRAIRLVRANAAAWNVDPSQVGVMGFSAGGHLASTLGTHFDAGDPAASDPVDRLSSRPDFMILMYPVISFVDQSTHAGSRRALLGDSPDPALLRFYSSELQVKDDTPPTFLAHADDDTLVPVENALLMYQALRARKIPAELHVLRGGGHGFGLATARPGVGQWTDSLTLWLAGLARDVRP